jgi:curli biogenesis system outer membrane secretion channel CsgG
MKRTIFTMAAVAVITFALVPIAAPAQSQPTIAVMNFSTEGLTSSQQGGFEPGVALSDLLTDQLVQAGKFNVLDRKTLDATLSEHQLGKSGEVSADTAITAGHLIGARYLVTGNILQLDTTGQSGAGASQYIPGVLGAVAGGVNRQRVTLKVAVRVVDAKTGQIVQSFTDEQTQTATSWSTAGFAGESAGGYSNAQFENSTMGHLINDEAAKIAAGIDPSKFAYRAAAAAIKGHIAAIDGSSIIISVGSQQGVAPGMYFDVIKTRSLVDPETHQTMTVDETIGKLQIDTVSPGASVAHVVSGRAPVKVNVVQEQP